MNTGVKQQGYPCSQLIQIRNKLNEGVLITHILNVNISNQPDDPKSASKLRRKIFLRLYNKPSRRHIMFKGHKREVEVLWEVPEGNHWSSAYYYTSSIFLSDIAVALHTKILISEISNEIRAANASWGNQWSISYFIIKPLALLNQPMSHGAIDVEEVWEKEDGDEHEEGEEE